MEPIFRLMTAVASAAMTASASVAADAVAARPATEVVVAIAWPRPVGPDCVVAGETLANQPASDPAPDLLGLGARNAFELYRSGGKSIRVGQVSRAKVEMTIACVDDRARKRRELPPHTSELENTVEVEANPPGHVLRRDGAVDPDLARIRILVWGVRIDIAVVVFVPGADCRSYLQLRAIATRLEEREDSFFECANVVFVVGEAPEPRLRRIDIYVHVLVSERSAQLASR
jgi:hypothetical protein